MAVQHGIWKIGEKPQPLAMIRLDSEALLEEQITRDIAILNSGWMLIGCQLCTDRDVVAQTIDYAGFTVKRLITTWNISG